MRRRHRPLTGTAGLVLAACMFLPMMRGCDHEVTTVKLTPFWVPYAYGLAFALVALARSRRTLALGTLVLRGLGVVAIASGAVALTSAPPLGVIELVLGVFLLAAIGYRGTSEVRIASTAVLVGAVSAAWFALWSATPDALLGAYLGLASSVGLFAGGLWWLAELAWQPDGRLPPALLGRRSMFAA